MATHRRRHPVDPEILDRLNAAIEYRGLSNAEIAERIRVSKSAVTQWRKGQIQPTGDHLRELARVLDEDPNYLMGKTDGAKKGTGALVRLLIKKVGITGLEALAAKPARELRKFLTARGRP